MILGFKNEQKQIKNLANELNIDWDIIALHYFPDHECKLTLPARLPEQVILYCTLDRPNEKLIPLMLAADTARECGASRLTLIAPYLCYMRQDKAFHPGESISQRSIGRFLAGLFDRLITVDPHLHRIKHLQEVIPDTEVTTLSAAELITGYIQTKGFRPLLLGPDSESEQWVSRIAGPLKLDFAICSKIRTDDHQVIINLPEVELTGRHIILVDDVISSGGTLANTARLCLAQGAQRVDVMVTHPLFAASAMDRLKRAGIREICSTDSIVHETNTLSLSRLLSQHL
ncbi:MAG: ribose-phosphate diphosphokinase [Gammaproteobacteria bacterium]|nr:ribose-phosphate diphosphokinase [Gammaproteobacteria bacterium]